MVFGCNAASKFHPGDALLEKKSAASPQSRNTPLLHHSAPQCSVCRLSNPLLFAPDNQQRRNQTDGGCRGHPEARHGPIAGCFNQRFARWLG
jgi:hypothetical protein